MDDFTARRALAHRYLPGLPGVGRGVHEDVAHRLRDLEERVSRQRRALFGVLDAVQAEIASRYGDGQASG